MRISMFLLSIRRGEVSKIDRVLIPTLSERIREFQQAPKYHQRLEYVGVDLERRFKKFPTFMDTEKSDEVIFICIAWKHTLTKHDHVTYS